MFQTRPELVFNIFRKNGLKGLKNLLSRSKDLKEKPTKTRSLPTSMQIEITTACNLSCTMCEHSHFSRKGNSMSFSAFKKIIDENDSLELLNMTGIGEALLNKDFFAMIEYAKKKGLYVWFNDNMTLMSEESARKIIEIGVDALGISLDGATKNTYEKIRKGADFNTVINNIKTLTRLKKELKKNDPKLFLAMVLMKENFYEMPLLPRIAKEVGVGKVSFVGVLTFEQNKNSSLDGITKEEIKSIFNQTKKTAEMMGIEVMGFPRIDKKEQAGICSFPWDYCYVTYDGNILPCCFITQRNSPEVYKESVMESLKKNNLEEIWNNKRYVELRKNLQSNTPPEFCKTCGMFNGIY